MQIDVNEVVLSATSVAAGGLVVWGITREKVAALEKQVRVLVAKVEHLSVQVAVLLDRSGRPPAAHAGVTGPHPALVIAESVPP